TTRLYDSPVQMMPPCDQTGVPGLVGLSHFHSSTMSGSASLISLRILPRVSPRQSPSSAILFEMCSDADWPWLASDFFMFSSWKFCDGAEGTFHQVHGPYCRLRIRPKKSYTVGHPAKSCNHAREEGTCLQREFLVGTATIEATPT